MPYHHGDLRSALVEAAESLLLEQGNWTFTLREVARAAGVSHNAPYNHFEDRRGLLAAVATRAFLAMRGSLSEAVASAEGADAASKMEAAAICYVRFAVDQPARFRLMFSAELANSGEIELDQATTAAFSVISDLILDGVANNEFRSDDLHTHAIAAWSLVHGLSSLIIDHRLIVESTVDMPANLVRTVGRTLVEGLLCLP